MERYNITLLEKYNVPEGRDVPMPHKKEWDNRLITEADGYQIPSNWSNRELDSLLIQLHSSITSGNMSRDASECEMIAAGACYLRKPGGSLNDRLIDATNFGSEPLEWNPSVVPVPGPVCFSAADRAYGLFICAFLFKILSKSSQNVVQSWSRIKERYLNFYSGREKPVKEWPTPQVAWLDRLKIQFSLVPRATRTALRLVNNLEMVYTDPQTVESGLISCSEIVPEIAQNSAPAPGDSSNPCHLHPWDHHGLILVVKQFDGTGFCSSKRSMSTALFEEQNWFC